ncbi:hypothetical protein IOD16_21860 [Saccharothrix sp. 6-C]|nr:MULTISPECIES: hypothetical protein [Saccharothrix]QQQ73888.1 hypothetical protein IOD16_21860 [Saccharothrix sp. 6-C]
MAVGAGSLLEVTSVPLVETVVHPADPRHRVGIRLDEHLAPVVRVRPAG